MGTNNKRQKYDHGCDIATTCGFLFLGEVKPKKPDSMQRDTAIFIADCVNCYRIWNHDKVKELTAFRPTHAEVEDNFLALFDNVATVYFEDEEWSKT